MSTAAVNVSRPCRLRELGQSPWLDDISRPMLHDGTLSRLIERDCISGVTSNPVIFERAIRLTKAYDSDIAEMAAAGATTEAIYEGLVETDIRSAAELLHPTFTMSGGRDGFVCLEVSPHLARDTAGTIAEADRLWRALDRPNVMIKVPGTVEGLPAIRALTRRGININVTLLFDPQRYAAVAEAYQAGIEDRLADGASRHPHSVASFFLSRIDTLVDSLLDSAGDGSGLRGTTAVALARIAYRMFEETIQTTRWRSLAAEGAAPQRLLWASTGAKDPAYSDVKYVDPLIAPETVTTLPLATLASFRDHGRVEQTLSADSARSRDRAAIVDNLAKEGVDLDDVMRKLEDEGIEKFRVPFDKLHQALAGKAQAFALTGQRG